MVYRPATASDVGSIHGVVSRMVEGTCFLPPTHKKLERVVTGGNFYHEGVWDGDELVAFMVGQLSETFLNDEVNAYEKGLLVVPEHRGGTIAVRLVRKFEAWARMSGAKNIWLGQSVGQNQTSTLHFFERLGYLCQGFITCKKL